jgi:predicted dehydrogenase
VLVRNAFSAISSGTERTRIEPGQRSLLARARKRPDLVKQALDKAMHEGIRSTREAVRRKLAEEAAAGYSCAGVIIEVGPNARGLSPGDRVACAGAGHANHAEVVSVPANLCVRVPDGVTLAAASLTTIAAIALHAVHVSHVRVGERTAVIGCGLVGQIALRLLHCAGVETFALDIDPARVQYAVAAGADHGLEVEADPAASVRRVTGGMGVDHAIVTAAAATASPLRLAAEILRDRGALTLVGEVPIEIPREPMYAKELSFRVSRSYGPGRYDHEYEERGLDYPVGYVRWTEQRNMQAVLALQRRGLLSLEDLVEDILTVEEAPSAYERLAGPATARPKGAIVLRYQGGEDMRVNGDSPDVKRDRLAVRTVVSGLHPAAQPSIGLIGFGSFARAVLVPTFQAAGARLELVGGGSGPSAAAAVRELGFSRVAESEEALIADHAIDAVVITTRHGSHAELSAKALRAGKHVFSEKPLALSVEELEDVIAAARASTGILAVGFNRRFSPLLDELRAFVRGSVPQAQITSTYRVGAGEVSPGHWLHDLEQGGGRVIGEACHFLDNLYFLADSPIVEVHAVSQANSETTLQARDTALITATHANGSIGSIAYVARSAPTIGKERLEAFGPGGIGVLNDYRSIELHGPSACRRRAERQPQKGHREEVQAFLAGITAGTPPVPLDVVANVSLAALAAVESMRTGLPVRVA